MNFGWTGLFNIQMSVGSGVSSFAEALSQLEPLKLTEPSTSTPGFGTEQRMWVRGYAWEAVNPPHTAPSSISEFTATCHDME